MPSSTDRPCGPRRALPLAATLGCAAGLLAAGLTPVVAQLFEPDPALTFQPGEPISAAAVNARFAALEQALVATQAAPALAELQALQDQLDEQAALLAALGAEADCPGGYVRDTTASGIVLCKRGADEVVKVGDFWIDRYEASLVSTALYNGGNCDGDGTQYGLTSGDYPASFPVSGNWSYGAGGATVHACSVPGRLPSSSMTYFQAQQACHLAGKHLCTNGEWQAAVAGTFDPGSHDGSSAAPCHTNGNQRRPTGAAGTVPGDSSGCISHWGAEDMIGNVAEWVDLWGQAGPPRTTDTDSTSNLFSEPWGAAYGDGKDATYGINGTVRADSPSGELTKGLPHGTLRGGSISSMQRAGSFFVSFRPAPTYGGANAGARCCKD